MGSLCFAEARDGVRGLGGYGPPIEQFVLDAVCTGHTNEEAEVSPPCPERFELSTSRAVI